MSAAGSRWMGLVARVPCVLCEHMGLGETPALVHHMKFGTGMTNKADDHLTIALCEFHHVGAGGVHQLKDRGLRLRYNVGELELLAMTIAGVSSLLHRRG